MRQRSAPTSEPSSTPTPTPEAPAAPRAAPAAPAQPSTPKPQPFESEPIRGMGSKGVMVSGDEFSRNVPRKKPTSTENRQAFIADQKATQAKGREIRRQSGENISSLKLSSGIDVSLLVDIANLLSLQDFNEEEWMKETLSIGDDDTSSEADTTPETSDTPAKTGRMRAAGKKLGTGAKDFGSGFSEGFSGGREESSGGVNINVGGGTTGTTSAPTDTSAADDASLTENVKNTGDYKPVPETSTKIEPPAAPTVIEPSKTPKPQIALNPGRKPDTSSATQTSANPVAAASESSSTSTETGGAGTGGTGGSAVGITAADESEAGKSKSWKYSG